VAHAYNPSYKEAETGRIVVGGQPGQKVRDTPISPISVCSVMHLSSQATPEAIGREDGHLRPTPDKNIRSYLKNN
jgi:hypothetical protein